MPNTAKLQLTFLDNQGSSVRYTFSHADPDVEATDVQALVSAMVTNGSIYKTPPVTPKSASIVVTSTTDVPLS